MSSSSETKAQRGLPRFLRLKVYGPIAVLVALVLLAWIPHLRNPEPLAGNVITRWGMVDHKEGHPYQFVIVVSGKYLQSYREEYQLDALCLHYDGTQDYVDAPGLQKSALYEIRDVEVEMIITADEAFVKDFKSGMKGTNYIAILVPKGVSMDQFSTLRQAFALGITGRGSVYGPP